MTAGCVNVGLRVAYYLELGLSHPATFIIVVIIITIIIITKESEKEKRDVSERTSKSFNEAIVFKPAV